MAAFERQFQPVSDPHNPLALDCYGAYDLQKYHNKYLELKAYSDSVCILDNGHFQESADLYVKSLYQILGKGYGNIYEYFDEKSGLFKFNEAEPICYSHGKYYEIGALIGKFGFSDEKKNKKK